MLVSIENRECKHSGLHESAKHMADNNFLQIKLKKTNLVYTWKKNVRHKVKLTEDSRNKRNLKIQS